MGEPVAAWRLDSGWIVESSVVEGFEVFVLDAFVADFGDGSCFSLQSRVVRAGLDELSGGPPVDSSDLGVLAALSGERFLDGAVSWLLAQIARLRLPRN